MKQCTGLKKIRSSVKSWPCHDAVSSKISAIKLNVCFIQSVAVLRKDIDNIHLRQNIFPSQLLHDLLFLISDVHANDTQREINSLPNSSSKVIIIPNSLSAGNNNVSTFI